MNWKNDLTENLIWNHGLSQSIRLQNWGNLFFPRPLVKIGDGNNNESGILANTTTHHIRGITGGSKISDGKFEGENGLIHWRATSTVMPRTNVHVTRYEIWSTAAFGEVAFGLYADIDLYPDTSRNWLAVGGRGHLNRLLV